jgi:hypothetical protein
VTRLVAFAGYAGCGKDEAAKPLLRAGYVRHCFGDIIKRQLDGIVHQYFHFSAFTEERHQKERIRHTLEAWGDDNNDAIMHEYFATLPQRAVNTRLVRVKEALAWRERGGIIYEVWNPNVKPATGWEAKCLQELRESGTIQTVIENNGSIEELHAKVKVLVGA